MVHFRYRHFAAQKFKTRNGFSLVELSLVLLIMGILFSMMFGFYFGVSQIASRESPLSREREKALRAIENIRGTLNQTYYLNNLRKRVYFVGKKKQSGDYRNDTLTLAAFHKRATENGEPGVREVSFYLRPEGDEGKGRMLMRREDQLVDKFPGKGGRHYELLDHALGLRFQYSLDGNKWLDSWHTSDRGRLPRLIRIQLVVSISGKEERYETMSYVGLYNN